MQTTLNYLKFNFCMYKPSTLIKLNSKQLLLYNIFASPLYYYYERSISTLINNFVYKVKLSQPLRRERNVGECAFGIARRLTPQPGDKYFNLRSLKAWIGHEQNFKLKSITIFKLKSITIWLNISECPSILGDELNEDDYACANPALRLKGKPIRLDEFKMDNKFKQDLQSLVGLA